MSNEAALGTIGRLWPNCLILSDEKNHASMIAGIRASGAERRIFRRNDLIMSPVCKMKAREPDLANYQSVDRVYLGFEVTYQILIPATIADGRSGLRYSPPGSSDSGVHPPA